MLGPGLWSVDAFLFGWRRSRRLPALEQAGRDYSSIIPRFNPTTAASVQSLALSFERMPLTRPLTVSSVTRQLRRDLLVGVSARDQLQHHDFGWRQRLVASCARPAS